MFQDNGDPMFTMSMYGSAAALWKAKAEYYQEKCDRLEERLRNIRVAEESMEVSQGDAMAEYFEAYNAASEEKKAILDSLDQFHKDMGL